MIHQMKLFYSVVLLVCLCAFHTLALTDEHVTETRGAKPGGKLIIDVDFGNIDVTTGATDKVVVTAYRAVDAHSKEKEKQYLKATPIVVTTEGNSVVVRARSKKGWSFWSWFGHTRTEGTYNIQVPATFDSDLQTEGGEVSVTGLTGRTKVETSGGDLKFERLHGPLKAETSGGTIEMGACDGTLDIESSGGSIAVDGGSGTLRGQTSGGNVTVVDFAGDANVESSGGRLRLANIAGNLNGETSGGSISAALSSPVHGDVKLETSAGSIEVIAPPDAALTVDAETSAGKVSSDLPITATTSSGDGLRGTINGGGKRLRLRTSAGSISIRSRSETAQQ
jgi:DUF4097 and DUF4098 domain-containing protein YvlB